MPRGRLSAFASRMRRASAVKEEEILPVPDGDPPPARRSRVRDYGVNQTGEYVHIPRTNRPPQSATRRRPAGPRPAEDRQADREPSGYDGVGPYGADSPQADGGWSDWPSGPTREERRAEFVQETAASISSDIKRKLEVLGTMVECAAHGCGLPATVLCPACSPVLAWCTECDQHRHEMPPLLHRRVMVHSGMVIPIGPVWTTGGSLARLGSMFEMGSADCGKAM